MSIIGQLKQWFKRKLVVEEAEEQRLFDFDYVGEELGLQSIDTYIKRYKSVFDDKKEIETAYHLAQTRHALYQKVHALGEVKIERLVLALKNLSQIESEREGFSTKMTKSGKDYDYISKYEKAFEDIIRVSNRQLRGI